MTLPELILSLFGIMVVSLTLTNWWKHWKNSDGRGDMEALQHLTVRLAGENQRKDMWINELSAENQELGRLLTENKRKLERCYQRVTPRVREEIEDSWPGVKP